MYKLYRHSEKLKGSILACLGFMLSPLSWWNDLYINIPIAYACAWLVSLLDPKAFTLAFAGAYLATNILGFILLHKGISSTLSKAGRKELRYSGRDLAKDLAVSFFYTGLMVLLAKMNIIRPVQDYLK